MADESKVTVNLKPLKQFAAAVAADLRSNANGPVRQCMKQWAVRVRAFLQERFDAFSKGGGWQDLAPSTKAGRRGARKGRDASGRFLKKGTVAVRSFSILRDTSTLFNALYPAWGDPPGAIQEDVPFGIVIGFGGPTRHPKGKATIADIARFHQEGGPHLPQRKIIVEPPQTVVDAMQGDLDRACAKLLKATGN